MPRSQIIPSLVLGSVLCGCLVMLGCEQEPDPMPPPPGANQTSPTAQPSPAGPTNSGIGRASSGLGKAKQTAENIIGDAEQHNRSIADDIENE